jgi:hypothetical protein
MRYAVSHKLPCSAYVKPHKRLTKKELEQRFVDYCDSVVLGDAEREKRHEEKTAQKEKEKDERLRVRTMDRLRRQRGRTDELDQKRKKRAEINRKKKEIKDEILSRTYRTLGADGKMHVRVRPAPKHYPRTAESYAKQSAKRKAEALEKQRDIKEKAAAVETLVFETRVSEQMLRVPTDPDFPKRNGVSMNAFTRRVDMEVARRVRELERGTGTQLMKSVTITMEGRLLRWTSDGWVDAENGKFYEGEPVPSWRRDNP